MPGEVRQWLKSDSDMTQILELSVQSFKIPMINMLRNKMEEVNDRSAMQAAM